MSRQPSVKTLSLFVALLVAGAGAVALLSAAAGAQNDSQPSYKIAVVDMGVLLSDYGKRKKLYDELQKDVDAKQKELDAMEAAITADRKKFETEGASMTDSQRMEMETKITTAQTNYRAAMATRQQMIDSNEKKVMRGFWPTCRRSSPRSASRRGTTSSSTPRRRVPPAPACCSTAPPWTSPPRCFPSSTSDFRDPGSCPRPEGRAGGLTVHGTYR